MAKNDFISKHMPEAKKAAIQHLRITVPQIEKIEALDELIGLELFLINLNDDMAVIYYKAFAPDFYPHIRKGLIENNCAKDHNFITSMFTGKKYKNTKDEFIRTHLGFYGSALQIKIDTYKHKETLEKFKKYNPNLPLLG